MIGSTRITRRGLLLGAAALAHPAIVRAQAREIVVGGPAGMAELMRNQVIPSFERSSGGRVLYEGSRSVVNLQKLRTSRGAPAMSIVMMDFDVMLTALRENLLQKVTPARVPLMTEIPAVALPYDAAWVNYGTPRIATVYNTARVPEGIPTWAALWTPRFRGRLSLPHMSLTSTPPVLAIAASLLTGKPPADAQYDVDAGFRKLAELKPNLYGIHTNGQQAQTLLEQGEAWAIPGDIGSYAARRRAEGLPFDFNKPTEGSFGLPSGVGLVAGAPNVELAGAFINELLTERAQRIMVEVLSLTPANPRVPPGADSVPLTELLPTDWEFVSQNRAAWIERFDREIAR